MLRILLVNPTVGAYTSLYPVCGKSGKLYGHSVYCSLRNKHVFEMPLEEYRKAADDISQASHLPNQRWIVDVLEQPPDTPILSQQGTKALEATRAGAIDATADSMQEVLTNATLDSVDADPRYHELLGMQTFELRALLLDLPEEQLRRLNTKPRLARAVMAREAHRPAIPA